MSLYSIVIPCLNEEKTLPLVLRKCIDSIRRLGIDCEIVVSDNGSSDNSADIAKRYGAQVVQCNEKGYGNALLQGICCSSGTYLLIGDADDSYDFGAIDGFVTHLGEGYDMVIGTRLKGSIERGAMPWLHRYIGTPLLTQLLNLFFQTSISDCNCGMRGFSRDAFNRMSFFSVGMDFASEMIIQAGILNLTIKEIPITYHKDGRGFSPHLKTWSDGWRHLRLMLLYAPHYLFIIPGALLFFVGFFFLLAINMFTIVVFDHKLNYHFSVLGSLLAVLGFQTMITGIFATVYLNQMKFNIQFSRFIRMFERVFKLEKAVLAGCALLMIGLAIDVRIVWMWIRGSYGELAMVGWAVFGSTCMIIGLQIIFSAFFIRILQLRKKSPVNQ